MTVCMSAVIVMPAVKCSDVTGGLAAEELVCAAGVGAGHVAGSKGS